MAHGQVPDLKLQAALSERDAWAQELFESNRFAASLVVERQVLADRLATVEARVRAKAARELAALRQERDHALESRDALLRERDSEARARREAEVMLARVTGSTSWRITAPMRHLLMLLLGRPRSHW